MLNVEEMAVISVPVVAADAWMREKAPAAPPAPAPPRFMSEEEDEESGSELGEEPELVAAVVRSGHNEGGEEPTFTPLPRDYAADFGNSVRTPSITEEHVPQPSVSPLSASSNDEERDLDVPTFMRRMKF